MPDKENANMENNSIKEKYRLEATAAYGKLLKNLKTMPNKSEEDKKKRTDYMSPNIMTLLGSVYESLSYNPYKNTGDENGFYRYYKFWRKIGKEPIEIDYDLLKKALERVIEEYGEEDYSFIGLVDKKYQELYRIYFDMKDRERHGYVLKGMKDVSKERKIKRIWYGKQVLTDHFGRDPFTGKLKYKNREDIIDYLKLTVSGITSDEIDEILWDLGMKTVSFDGNILSNEEDLPWYERTDLSSDFESCRSEEDKFIAREGEERAKKKVASWIETGIDWLSTSRIAGKNKFEWNRIFFTRYIMALLKLEDKGEAKTDEENELREPGCKAWCPMKIGYLAMNEDKNECEECPWGRYKKTSKSCYVRSDNDENGSIMEGLGTQLMDNALERKYLQYAFEEEPKDFSELSGNVLKTDKGSAPFTFQNKHIGLCYSVPSNTVTRENKRFMKSVTRWGRKFKEESEKSVKE